MGDGVFSFLREGKMLFHSKLHKSVYESENLNAAWNKVRSNKGVSGVDEMDVIRFNKMMFNNLMDLKERLCKGTYRPKPVRRFNVQKPDGGKRPIGVLTVEDRIVQRAVLQVIEPLFDKEFSACNFGYRKGISVQHALEQVGRHFNRGFDWVLDADIEDFFQNIDQRILKREFAKVVPDRYIRHLLEAWLSLGHDGVGQPPLVRKEAARVGILQGSPLSPLLANIYLAPFDRAVSGKGFNLIRYGDDLIVLCDSKHHAETALKYIRKALAKLKLNLNPRKTLVTHFAKGVRFLGHLLKTQKTPDGDRLSIQPLKPIPSKGEKRYGGAIH